MREYDVDIAVENVAGGLYELEASGRLTCVLDPVEVAETLRRRYEALWGELTRVDEFDLDERWRIEHRVRRINELGFDVEELSISRGRSHVAVPTAMIEEDHHARELRNRTGLDVQENRRDACSRTSTSSGRGWNAARAAPIPRAVATVRWLAEVYEPITSAVPRELRGQLRRRRILDELLEHRYLPSWSDVVKTWATTRPSTTTSRRCCDRVPQERQLRLDARRDHRYGAER